MACCTCIAQDEVGILTKLGEFKRLLYPGWNCIVPCLESVSGSISTRIKQLDVACETKTLDNVFVNIVVSVQYQPLQSDEAYYNAFFKLTNIDSQMRPYVFDTVRSSVPQLNIDQVFEVSAYKAIVKKLCDAPPRVPAEPEARVSRSKNTLVDS
jgi:regulator of protease activity HflC (stomatin/prohibitin superfamily)